MTTRFRLGLLSLALALLSATCGGGLVVAGGGLAVLGALEGRRTRWTAPGMVQADLEAGRWEVAQEVPGGPGQDVTVPPLPADLVLEVHTAAGQAVTVREPRSSSTYGVGDVTGQVRFVFELEQPAAVQVEARGGAGTRLSLGRGPLSLIGKPALALTGAIVLLSAVPTLSTIGLVLLVVGYRAKR